MNKILFEEVLIHDKLNPLLWDENDNLREDVREKVLDVVQEFQDFIPIDVNIIDIYILGSNAQYNYTEYSDLDLHILTNFEFADASPDIIEALYNYEKKSFNEQYDITIKGINVEVYVQDVKAMNASKGVYSVLRDKWIKKPEPDINVEVDNDSIDRNYEVVKDEVELKLLSNDPAEVADFIDRLYLMRRESLAVYGEYGVGNQVFKKLRNNDYLQKLKDRMYDLKSNELSLEELKRFRNY